MRIIIITFQLSRKDAHFASDLMRRPDRGDGGGMLAAGRWQGMEASIQGHPWG